MATASNLRVLRIIPLLITICLCSLPVYANNGGGTSVNEWTKTYRFLADKSTITQTGGIAGVHWTYRVEGRFILTVDYEAGTAAFSQVDANAVDESPLQHILDPNKVFNMTALSGTILDSGDSISFEGIADDGSSIQITLTFVDDTVTLKGQTTPPPKSADFFIFSLDAVAKRKYSGGTGEPNDPYQIATAADLIAIGEDPNDYDKHFILTDDIDLDPNLPGRKVFDKAVIASFTGVFDGRDHTISHLTIIGASCLGLFGQLGRGAEATGEVKNLGVIDVSIAGSGRNVGGLVGVNNPGCHVTDCYSTGKVSGDSDVGGLVGSSSGIWNTAIVRCYSEGVVSGIESVGGLVGGNLGSVTQCFSKSAVCATSDVGGLIGGNYYTWFRSQTGRVTECYSTGTVSGTERVGGLVGSNGGDVTHCYSIGTVSSTGESVGGLVGCGFTEFSWYEGQMIEHGGTVIKCFWDIQTSGQTASVGGTGKTTAEMQDPNTFVVAGWNFAPHDIWVQPLGEYPILWWQLPPQFGLPTFSGGTGEPNDPYRISTQAELNGIGYNPRLMGAHFELVNDINLEVIDFHMIGNFSFPFRASFNGNGHEISHLTVKGESYVGLFAYLGSAAEVKNLGIVDVNIAGSNDFVGGLAGRNDSGAVTQCYSTGRVSGPSVVGGLVGCNSQGTVTQCYSTGAVSGGSFVGGLVGLNDGHIAKSYSAGAVEGAGQHVGGFVGGNIGRIATSFWDIQTSGQSGSVGGAGLTTAEMMDPLMLGLNGFGNDPNWVLDAGRDYPRLAWEGTPGGIIPEPIIDWVAGQGTAESPYRIDTPDQLIFLGKASILWDRHFVLGADIDLDPALPGRRIFRQAVIPVLSGVFDGRGHVVFHLTIEGTDNLGLFGSLMGEAQVRNISVVDTDITGSGDGVGGLVGYNYGSITNSYSLGSVSGKYNVGVLVGWNVGTIATSYGSGSVSGEYEVGGLVGSNYGSISNSYSRGSVSGNSDVGGLVGYNYGSIANSYNRGSVSGVYDVGGLVGDGYAPRVSSSFWDTQTSGHSTSAGGIGKTTAEMQTASTFLNAGWDFVDETANGTEDIWWILEGQDYPRLWWEAE